MYFCDSSRNSKSDKLLQERQFISLSNAGQCWCVLKASNLKWGGKKELKEVKLPDHCSLHRCRRRQAFQTTLNATSVTYTNRWLNFLRSTCIYYCFNKICTLYTLGWWSSQCPWPAWLKCTVPSSLRCTLHDMWGILTSSDLGRTRSLSEYLK